MNLSKECLCACACVLERVSADVIFFFLACDVPNSMTDAGMWVLVCAAVRKFEGVCVCVCWRRCGELRAILAVQWVFLTFIYPGWGLAEQAFSLFFSINTWLRDSDTNIHTWEQVWCIFSATCLHKGHLLSLLAHNHPSLVFHSEVFFLLKLKYAAPNLLFTFAFSVDFCMCTLEQLAISSVVLKVSPLPEWASLSNFWSALPAESTESQCT